MSLMLRGMREPYFNPGCEIAHGALVEVEDSTNNDQSFGPHVKNTMTLFDCRADYMPTSTDGNGNELKSAIDSPKFMHAMPSSYAKMYLNTRV